jgi:hypothetical protein
VILGQQVEFLPELPQGRENGKDDDDHTYSDKSTVGIRGEIVAILIDEPPPERYFSLRSSIDLPIIQ